MSDRTAASLFGGLFKKFASDPTEQHMRWARDLWRAMVEGGYDFHPYQMYVDEELCVLGLARQDLDPDHGYIYGPNP